MTQVRVIVVTTEAGGHEAGRVEGRLGDAQHRAGGQLARGVQPGVAEAGDDGGVEALALASRICSATPAAPKTSSKCPSIDAGPKLGWRPTTSVPGAATARAASAMPRGHGGGGVGVDQQQLHAGSWGGCPDNGAFCIQNGVRAAPGAQAWFANRAFKPQGAGRGRCRALQQRQARRVRPGPRRMARGGCNRRLDT
jgi:hypothetical protein